MIQSQLHHQGHPSTAASLQTLGDLEPIAQPAGSSPAWGLSFPSDSLGLNSNKQLSWFLFLRDVGLALGIVFCSLACLRGTPDFCCLLWQGET